MNALKNSALLVLAALSIALGVIAWRQHAELRSLRAEKDGELATLKQRITASDAKIASLKSQLADAQQKLAKATGDEAFRRDDPGPEGRMRSMAANAAEMMSRPEIQKLMALRQKAGLDLNYAAMFKLLKLSPEKLEQLKKLMVDRQQVGADVFAAAAQQGLDPMQNRRELARMTAEGQAKVDTDIKSLLGDSDYATYQNYQATLPQRDVVNQLQQALSYSSTPLTDSQAEQLVQLLAQNQPTPPSGVQPAAGARVMIGGPDGVGYVGPAGGPAGAPITDAAIAASQSLLSEAQLAALQQLQQQQSQMRSLMQSVGAPKGGPAIFFNSVGATPPAPPPGG